MSADTVGETWLPVLRASGAATVAGAILLAWMPRGDPSGARPRALPEVWVASFVLGALVVLAIAALERHGHPFTRAGAVTIAAVLALLLVARLATLPAAILPRRSPPERTWSAATAIGMVGVLVALGWSWTRASQLDPRDARAALAPASSFAALAAASYALERARAPSWVDVVAAALLVLAFVSAGSDGASGIALLGCAAAAWTAFATAWIRRGDRRALWLAALAAAVGWIAHPDGAAIAIGAWVALVVASAAPVRVLAASASLVAAAIAFALRDPDAGRYATLALGLVTAIASVLVVAILVLRWSLWRRGAPERTSSGAPAGREELALLIALAVALAAHRALPTAIGASETGAIVLPALVWLVLLFALSLGRLASTRRAS